jgi:hypothetical protein
MKQAVLPMDLISSRIDQQIPNTQPKTGVESEPVSLLVSNPGNGSPFKNIKKAKDRKKAPKVVKS